MEDRKILQMLYNRAETAIDALARRFGACLYAIAHIYLGVL